MSKCMKKTVSIISFAVIVFCIVIFAIRFFHNAVVASVSDTSEWILTNDVYNVIPVVDESKKEVSFQVENDKDVIVFDANVSWRLWDFKSIELCENHDIIIVSGDMGEIIYKYNDGTWILQ